MNCMMKYTIFFYFIFSVIFSTSLELRTRTFHLNLNKYFYYNCQFFLNIWLSYIDKNKTIPKGIFVFFMLNFEKLSYRIKIKFYCVIKKTIKIL